MTDGIFLGFDFGMVPPVVIVCQFKDGVVTVLNESYSAFNKQNYYEEICTNMRKLSPDRFSISNDLINTYKQAIQQMRKEKYMWESKEELRSKIVGLEEELQYFKSMAESLRCAGNSTADKLEQENVILRGKLEAAKKEIEIFRKDNALLRQEREMLRGVHDRKKENEMLKKDNEALKEGSAKLVRAMTKDIDKSIIKENISLKQKFSALEDLHRSTLEVHSNVSGNCHKEIKRLKKKVNRLLRNPRRAPTSEEVLLASIYIGQVPENFGAYQVLNDKHEEMRSEYQECWKELSECQQMAISGGLLFNGCKVMLRPDAFKPSYKFIKDVPRVLDDETLKMIAKRKAETQKYCI